ncbi:MAG: YHS domain-containing protein [Polyangiaceae bacterium]
MRVSSLAVFTFASSLVFSSALLACGGDKPAATPAEVAHHDEHGEHGHGDAPKSANVKKAGEAKIGDTQACPISGEEFVVAETSPKSEFNGKTYYFCCAGCKKKFDADPKKAVEKLGGS